MDKAVLKQKAEDYALTQWEGQLPWNIIQKAYYDGYIDCEKEMNEIGLALQSDMDKTIEQNIALKEQIDKMKSCSNCIHYSSTFGLCHYSMGDKDYDCRGRKWEIKEND